MDDKKNQSESTTKSQPMSVELLRKNENFVEDDEAGSPTNLLINSTQPLFHSKSSKCPKKKCYFGGAAIGFPVSISRKTKFWDKKYWF